MTRTLKLLPAILAAVLAIGVAGCASADKTTGTNASDNAKPSSSSMGGMSGSSSSAGSVAGADSSMSQMKSMSSGTTTVVNAQGVPVPVPVRTIATGTWKQMRITAQETTPVPFYVYTGQGYSEVKPGKASFHLMVMLNDKTTGVAIPYATVWATIYHDGKMISTAEQWAMLSEYMGPHYGNDVTLPGPGTYTLKLLVSAPKAALHVEYAHMWTGSHTLTAQFHWAGKVSSAS